MTTIRVPAHLIAEVQTREIERLWHSSLPKPRARVMGLQPEESLHQRRRRELREMLATDDSLRARLYQLQ